MATEWEGKSRGTVLGYRIFIFFIKKLGLDFSYFFLHFVVLYFCFFSLSSSRAIFYYFHKRRHYGKLKSLLSIYRSYYSFGQTLIDKAAISSGLRNRFSYTFDGIENIKNLLDKNKGGILVSAHVGNFEVAQFFLEEVNAVSKISIITWDREHEEIKAYLETVTSKSSISFIRIQEDLSHIFEIHSALSNGELVCFTGDRHIEGAKFLEHSLMGETAKFPLGPFLLASRLNFPVLFVYVMKESKKKYHLYARTTKVKRGDAQGLLKAYVDNLEWILDKYPFQWFNYFNFWGKKENLKP
ncbi:LpxL/LpxP family acyltransferase [Pareuzebyella sediminis]|uniref:LpxL/LpxP family acyltransferase n=1 Tax=Pareuzebyella sediminis TaxID=2607998 RepID=UPI0011EDD008|nr:lipid A biosynthesis acyltransferase [Pareuzebyella sediminis]